MRKLFYLTMFFSSLGYSQYGDAYHKADTYRLEQMRQDRMNQNDAAHRASMNSNSGSGVKGNYGSGNNYSYEKTARERAEKAEKELELSLKNKKEKEAIEKQQQDDYKEYRQVARHYYTILNDAGIDWGEIEAAQEAALGDGTPKTDPHYSAYRQKTKDAVLIHSNYNKLFLDNLNTSTYEELMNYALNSMFYPLSALKNFEKLQQRFPEKSEEIEITILTQLIPIHFNGFQNKKEGIYFSTYKKIWRVGQDMFLDKYLELEKKYPALAMKVNEDITTENTPYVRLAQRAYLKHKNEKEMEGYSLKQLNVKCVSPYSINEKARRPNYYLYLNLYPEDGGELRKFEAEDWIYYAKRQDISVVKLLKYLMFIEGDLKESGYSLTLKKSYFNYNSKEIIAQCAQLNDPSALNLYGLMIAAGIVKEEKIKCLDYFKKAAELGEYNGALNYEMAGSWNIKGLSQTHSDEAKKVLDNFKKDPTKKEEFYK